MSSRLERAANIATIVTCVMICVALGTLLLRNREPQRSGPATGEEILAQVKGVNFGSAEATVVFVVRSTCQYCTESLPFYRSLVDRRNSKSASVRFVAVSAEPTDVVSRYLLNGGVKFDQLVEIRPPNGLRVYTPTVTPSQPTRRTSEELAWQDAAASRGGVAECAVHPTHRWQLVIRGLRPPEPSGMRSRLTAPQARCDRVARFARALRTITARPLSR